MGFSMTSIWCYVVYISLSFLSEVMAEYCTGYGHSCVYPQHCCGATCCVDESFFRNHNSWSFWNMWYFWFIVIFILMSCFGGCGYWRRRQWMITQQRLTTQNFSTQHIGRPGHHSTITVPIYPGYTQNQYYPTPEAHVALPTGNFPSPPPYAEVISKPEVYPVNKDELPPYPGFDGNTTGAIQTYPSDLGNRQMGINATAANNIPGLPPYSQANQQTDAAAAAANVDLTTHATAANQQQGHTQSQANDVLVTDVRVAQNEGNIASLPPAASQMNSTSPAQNVVSR